MLVKDVMKPNPFTIGEKASVLEAKDLMKKNNICKLPVMNKNGRMTGIITSNDLLKCTPSDATTLDVYEIGYLLSKLTVDKIMIKNVQTVTPEETVEEAARIMSDGGFGCLPVMQDDQLVGIITETDLFDMFIKMFNTREPGLRVIIDMSDEPGTLAVFARKIGDKKGRIVSCVQTPSTTPDGRIVTVKVTGMDMATFREIAESSGTVKDIREVN